MGAPVHRGCRSAVTHAEPRGGLARSAGVSGRGTVEYVGDGLVTLFLCGDLMPGWGVDQIVPHPGNPRLREVSAGDTRRYAELAEAVHGRIPTRSTSPDHGETPCR